MRVDVTKDVDAFKRIKNDKAKKMKSLKQEMVKDINKYVPFGNGDLKKSALKYAATSSKFIRWDTPYAHFQWFGKVMVGIKSHRPWARYREEKVYTSRDLTYRSGGGKDWIAKASDRHLKSWVEFVKKLYTR